VSWLHSDAEAVTTKPSSGLNHLLDHQAGVITRQQALRFGLTRNVIYFRLKRDRWQQLHWGVYATFNGPLSRGSSRWAAVLGAGSRAVLSHQTAAELQGLLAPASPGGSRSNGYGTSKIIHVTVPRGRSPITLDGVRVHFSRRVDEARHPVLEPARTRVEETILDLAVTSATATDAVGWVLRGCASRRTTPDRVRAAMELRPRLKWRAELAGAVGDASDGVQSLLEWNYLHNVEEPHGLPTGIRQRRVAAAGTSRYEDVHYRRYGLVVELDGRAAHPETERGKDRRRDNATAAAGFTTLRYTWAEVTLTPCKVAAEVGQALRRRGWPGELRPCGAGCLAGRDQHPAAAS
jgi:very-short-patch-repair endonuclease